MVSSSPFEVEERGEITILNVRSPARGLVLSNPTNMDRLWSILQNVAVKKQKVLLVMYDHDALAPERVDEAWEDISHTSTSKNQLPPQVRALQTNMRKLIDYYLSSRTLCIGALSGAVDFDLFGLFASSHFRICTTGSTFENRTIDRAAPPGSASIWFLSRVVGFAHAGEIMLENKSLTAAEARDLRLVNAVVPPDELRTFARQKAEYFASKSQLALSALVIAMNHMHQNLPEYLDEVGTGFNALFFNCNTWFSFFKSSKWLSF